MEAYEKVKQTTWFQAFRTEGYPTSYNENRIGTPIDLHLSAINCVFISLLIAVLCILPGHRGKQRIFIFTRYFTSLTVGYLIFFCNFEHLWESSEILAKTQYKAGTSKYINASIGLHIGLRGINITLKAIPDKNVSFSKNTHEIMDYNEHFSWEWNQGRFGFGSQAGKFHQEYRKAQIRGSPYPILWVAEYFTFDGEGIRFRRNYRLAGWYTHITTWLAFPLWLLANILFMMVIQYGALFLIFTGSSLVFGNIIYGSIRNFIPLKIPFEGYQHEETILEPHFSWCFYLNLINGLFCIFLGVLTFFSDLIYPDETAEFFGIDVLQSYEDDIERKVDFSGSRPTGGLKNRSIYAGLRKRSNFSNRLSRLQVSSFRKKPPITSPRVNIIKTEALREPTLAPKVLNPHDSSVDLYENLRTIGEEN